MYPENRILYVNEQLYLRNWPSLNSLPYSLYLGLILPYRKQPLQFFFLAQDFKNNPALYKIQKRLCQLTNEKHNSKNVCTLTVHWYNLYKMMLKLTVGDKKQ